MATKPCAECGRPLKIRRRTRAVIVECRRCAALTKKIKNRAACAQRYQRVRGKSPAPAPFCSAADVAAIFQAAAVLPAQPESATSVKTLIRADYLNG